MAKRKSKRVASTRTKKVKRHSAKKKSKAPATFQKGLSKTVGAAAGVGALAAGSIGLARALRDRSKLQKAKMKFEQIFPQETDIRPTAAVFEINDNKVEKIINEIATEQNLDSAAKSQLKNQANQLLQRYIAEIPLAKYQSVIQSCTLPERVFLGIALENDTGRHIEFDVNNNLWRCLHPSDRPFFVQKFKERVVANLPGFDQVFKEELLAASANRHLKNAIE